MVKKTRLWKVWDYFLIKFHIVLEKGGTE